MCACACLGAGNQSDCLLSSKLPFNFFSMLKEHASVIKKKLFPIECSCLREVSSLLIIMWRGAGGGRAWPQAICTPSVPTGLWGFLTKAFWRQEGLATPLC